MVGGLRSFTTIAIKSSTFLQVSNSSLQRAVESIQKDVKMSPIRNPDSGMAKVGLLIQWNLTEWGPTTLWISDPEKKENGREIHCTIIRMRSRSANLFRSWLWSWLRMIDDRYWSRPGKTSSRSCIVQQWEKEGACADQVRVDWDFYAYCTVTTKSEAADVEEAKAIEIRHQMWRSCEVEGWRGNEKELALSGKGKSETYKFYKGLDELPANNLHPFLDTRQWTRTV